MEKISHSDAISIVKKWFDKNGWKVYSREIQFGDSYHNVDLILKNEYGNYAICEVKCSETDFTKALSQINNVYNILQEKIGMNEVYKRVAITRDLYEVFKSKDKIHRIKSDLNKANIHLLVIYRTKVDKI